MALDYHHSVETIKRRLEVAHDPTVAKIRGEFFEAEYAFFRKHIRDQNVLVAGSGLGHDAMEVARYNRNVVGVELIQALVAESEAAAKKAGVTNVSFVSGDITQFEYPDGVFAAAILNMGTIGNFDDKRKVLAELIRVASIVYFDFYPPSQNGLEKRRAMYAEEKWVNVRIDGVRIVSDDGLETSSLAQDEVESLVRSLNAGVEFHAFHEFSVMAVVNNSSSRTVYRADE